MRNKKFAKFFAGSALTLAMAMTMAMAAPAKASAANKEVNTVNPGVTDDEKTAKDSDPTKLEGLDPTAEDDASTDDVDESYVDTDIDVWAHTQREIVYSVDVEWGAMTFQYETGSWDPATHMQKNSAGDGAGWVVYDNKTDKKLGDVQDAINRVTITNHSNAEVYANLAYTSEADYSDINGVFSASEDSANEDKHIKTAFDATKSYIGLDTADNQAGADGAGEAAVGNIYFKPKDISDDHKADSGITKWTKIGKITVSLLTEEPETATEETP